MIQPDKLQLNLETLEDRQMLSTVDIFAAGATNTETIELQINQETVQTFTNIGGNADRGEFVRLSFSSDQPVDPGQVRVVFTNDLYQPEIGFDRNVRVDRIVVSGQTIQTESSDVFSTGTFLRSDGVAPGFGRGETLNSNGYFQFPSRASGSTVTIRARGDAGTERFNLRINGQVVETFKVSNRFQDFSFTSSGPFTADDVAIEFINDDFRPEQGIDLNLTVDFINVDGTVFQTESPSVFSTGTYKPDDGIVPGFGRGETLNTNGYFQFSTSTPTPTPPPAPAPQPAPVPNEQFAPNSGGNVFNGFIYDENAISFTTNNNPFRSNSVGLSDNNIQGRSFRINSGPVAIGVNDDDPFAEDRDNARVTNNLFIGGRNVRPGDDFEIEYSYLVREAGTGRIINIYAVESEHRVVGFVSDAPLRQGVDYNFIQRTSRNPRVLYSQLATSFLRGAVD